MNPSAQKQAGEDELDCLVIGGGPAGLTAALYLGRFRRGVRVVDKGWSRAAWITNSHNLPGFPDGIAGPQLLDGLRVQARRYGAAIETGVVEDLSRGEDGVFTATVGARGLSARTVLLAGGVVERKPPVEHLAAAVMSGLIRTCPICDGYESIGKRIGVLGVGEHAAREALFLRTYTDRLSVLLMAADADVLSPDTRRALADAGVAVAHVVIGGVRLGDDGVTVVETEDGAAHTFDLVYSAFGVTPQTALAAALGARMDSAGKLLVDEHQTTSVNGLFAAGDLVRGLNQISVAEGEAAIAATAIHNSLPSVS